MAGSRREPAIVVLGPRGLAGSVPDADMPNGAAPCGVAPFGNGCPAVSYSPTPSPGQYHRR